GSGRSVDLQCQQIVAAHARGPGAVDLHYDAVIELDGGHDLVFDIDLIPLARFVAAKWGTSRAAAAYRAHGADEFVHDVAPVGKHIEDEAAAFGLLVVPARPLGGVEFAVEHPPAEVKARRQDFPEE